MFTESPSKKTNKQSKHKKSRRSIEKVGGNSRMPGDSSPRLLGIGRVPRVPFVA